MKKQTRWIAMLLAVVMLIPSLLVPVSAETPFIDVAENAWYAEAVNYVSENGYMVGVSDNTFAPNASVTRAMFVTVLARVAGAELDDASSSFADVPAGRWYTGAINWAAEKGIVNGVGAGKFAPNSSITRQDMCTILYRYADAMSLKLRGLNGTEKVFADAASIADYAKQAVSFCSKAGLILGFEDGSFGPNGKTTRAQMAAIILRLQDALKPFVSFSAAAGDLNVNVEAPEEALPANASMVVSVINSKKQLDEIAEKAEGKVLAAVDISFHDITGEIEPNEEVEVNIIKAGLDPNSVRVVHIKDSGEMEPVENVEAGEEANSVKFSAKDFSIYAVIGDGETGEEARAELKFYNGETLVATYYLKKTDTLEEMAKIAPDPGTGIALGNDQIFYGWSIARQDANNDARYDTVHYGASYSTTTRRYTIEDIHKYVQNLNITEGMVIEIYAMIFNVWTVTYTDEDGIMIAVQNALMPLGQTEATFEVTETYSFTDPTKNFEGWQVDSGSDKIVSATYRGESVEAPYPQGTILTLSGSVALSVNSSQGHWLVFDENGRGATYNAPIFIKQNETTRVPSLAMERPGYTFGGWYEASGYDQEGNPLKDENGNVILKSEEYSFGQTLSDKLTLYAKWNVNSSINYTVVVWKQNITGDGYDFEEAIHLTLQTGSSTNYVVSPVTAQNNNTVARINGTNYSYTGFHLGDYDSNVTVNPAGGTVVHVHFDRNQHTLHFQVEGYIYTPTTSNNGTQYGLVGGEYVQLTRHGRGTNGNPYYWTYNDSWNSEGPRYDGTRYTRSTGWQDIKTITALYQQNILLQFPIVGTNGITYNNGERWQPVGNTSVGNGNNSEVIVSLNTMPDETITFHLNEATRPLKTMYYYVEALPGGTVDKVVDGISFTLLNTIAARYNFVRETGDFTNIDGFTKYKSDPVFGSNGRALESNRDESIDFYYTRNTYKINYMDGAYFNGNGGLIAEEENQGQLKEISGVAYQADVSSYNEGGANYYTPTKTGYVFDGWYLDQSCTAPCTFGNLPDGGITAYAKWRQIEYRVFLHPNAMIEDEDGNFVRDTTLDWGTEDQQMNFRIAYNGQVSTPTGLRTGYEFSGWYTNEGLTTQYNSDTRLTDSTVPETPAYDKTKDMTDNIEKQIVDGKEDNIPMDIWGLLTDEGINKDVNRYWITRKLDLYAKWSKVIVGAAGIGIEYNANGGSNAPSDRNLYKDNVSAVAQGAATPPRAAEGEPELVFVCWVVQHYNENTNEFEDTNVNVYPGGNFFVKVDDARRITEAGSTSENPKYRYTVQLKAKYGPKDPAEDTHVTWVANGGKLDEAFFAEDDWAGWSTKSDGAWVESAEVQINARIPVVPSEAVSKQGYQFLGWARVKEGDYAIKDEDGNITGYKVDSDEEKLTADDLWLVYHPAETDNEEAYFSLKGSTDPVKYVAADEKDPYQTLYAVWGNPCYYVFNAATGKLTAYDMPADDQTIDLTKAPYVDAANSYYTGWFSKYAGVTDENIKSAVFKATEKINTAVAVTDAKLYDGSNRYINAAKELVNIGYEVGEDGKPVYDTVDGKTVLVPTTRLWDKNNTDASNPGNALKPTVGAIYYLKLVPKDYFQSKFLFIYNTGSGEIKELCVVSATDDNLLSYSKLTFLDKDGKEIEIPVRVGTNLRILQAKPGHSDATGDEDDPYDWVNADTIFTTDSLFSVSGLVMFAHFTGVKLNDIFEFKVQWQTPDGAVLAADTSVSIDISSSYYDMFNSGTTEPAPGEDGNNLNPTTRSAAKTSLVKLVENPMFGDMVEEYVLELAPDYCVTGLD